MARKKHKASDHPIRLMRWAEDGYPPINLSEEFDAIRQLINYTGLLERSNRQLTKDVEEVCHTLTLSLANNNKSGSYQKLIPKQP